MSDVGPARVINNGGGKTLLKNWVEERFVQVLIHYSLLFILIAHNISLECSTRTHELQHYGWKHITRI